VTEQPIGEAVAKLLVGNTAGAADRVALRACG
jgi:hypothetical protein